MSAEVEGSQKLCCVTLPNLTYQCLITTQHIKDLKLYLSLIITVAMCDKKWSLTEDGKFTESHMNFRSRIRTRVKKNKPLTALQEAFAEWYDNIQTHRSVGGSSSSSDPPVLKQNLKKPTFTGAQRKRRYSIRKKESMGVALNSKEKEFLEWYDSNKGSTNPYMTAQYKSPVKLVPLSDEQIAQCRKRGEVPAGNHSVYISNLYFRLRLLDEKVKPQIIKYFKCLSSIIRRFDTASFVDHNFLFDLYKALAKKGYTYMWSNDGCEEKKNRTYVRYYESERGLLGVVRYTDTGELECGHFRLNIA